jgi:N-acetylmuramoyl-L-alanine amidase
MAKIGLRAGHSDNCEGAVGIVNEHEQMKKYYVAVKTMLESNGHTVIDCNSNGSTAIAELSEGADKANSNNVDLFVSLHMNASDGRGHGVEALVSSESSKACTYAQNLCDNFSALGFTNRGVKYEKLYEMNHISAPNIIFEICFCDSQIDIDVFNKYSWEQLAANFCNAIDSNISKNARKLGWNQNTTGWWYCTDVANGYYYKSQWKSIDGEWYCFDDQGYARTCQWVKQDNKWYYLKKDCKMAKSEWVWDDGECYCFDKTGALYMNCVTPDGYTVDADGAWDSKIPQKK